MLIGSSIRGIFSKYQNEMPKWPEKPLTLVRSGTQCLAIVTKLLSSNCEAHLVESYYCKESTLKKWLRDIFSSYLMNEKRYLKILNSNFHLIQTTCLCFKMASIGRLRFSSVYHLKLNCSLPSKSGPKVALL